MAFLPWILLYLLGMWIYIKSIKPAKDAKTDKKVAEINKERESW